MRKILLVLILNLLLITSGCAQMADIMNLQSSVDQVDKTHIHSNYCNHSNLRGYAIVEYISFEDALEFASDVAIVQYIGSRPFGDYLKEFEFQVSERILGDSAERIFVYIDTSFGYHVRGDSQNIFFDPTELYFQQGAYYLLPLRAINNPLANTHEDGFTFIMNIVIALDDLGQSRMYGDLLKHHTAIFDFEIENNVDEIVISIVELTKNNVSLEKYIRSEDIQDVLLESPYVVLVEINDPLRLSHEQSTTDWVKTDLYHVTVIQVLNGNIEEGFEGVVVFPANVADTSEHHIVAIRPIREGSSWFNLTSRNSLWSATQLEEISDAIYNLNPQ